MSFSQQLLRPSKDMLRFLRKRGHRKLQEEWASGASARQVGLRNLQPSQCSHFISPHSRVSLLCFVSRDLEHERRARSCALLAAVFPVFFPVSHLQPVQGCPQGCCHRPAGKDKPTDGPQTLPGQCALLHCP